MIDVDTLAFHSVVLEARNPVLVDFWAKWCKPCQALLPVLEQVEKKYTNVSFVKIDVEICSSVVARYGIRSIPTLVVFNKGKPVTSITGNYTEAKIQQVLKEIK